MKFQWNQPRFIKSAVLPKDYPTLKNDQGKILPEIAIAGRSNVGKSSLLGHLFQQKQMVKVSATPGKTQHLNFFVLDKELVLVDLPGYGFAKVPPQIRKEWGPMIQSYLTSRPSLGLILFLFDIRREPNEEDLQLMDWIAHAGKGVILVLTKIDKVTKNELQRNTQNILTKFQVPNLHFVHYSVPKDLGRNGLINMVEDAFKGEE